MSETNLVWFKNDLRVNDNESLTRAVENNSNVIAIYFFDPRNFEKNSYGFKKTEKYRANFLIETVNELKENLNKLNISLFIYSKKPKDVLPEFIETNKISKIYLQKEWTTEEEKVVTETKDSVKLLSIEWIESYDQFLYHPEDILYSLDKIPEVFTKFRKKCEKYTSVRSLYNISKKLPLENRIENTTNTPKLKDLGFELFDIHPKTAFPFKGGENQAIQRIQEYFWQTNKLSYYKNTRNGLIGTDYSSKLSAWLANGSISPRTIYYEVKKYEKEVDKNQSTYWLIFELIWRDFFKYTSLKYENAIFKIEGILNKNYNWYCDTELIEQWIKGQTSEPFVNANMVELSRTGWMSNRGRQNVASFFAKEQNLDWRIGAAYFESLLIDYDVHSNYGNWMYVAGVGNDPRDRKFNIKLQSKRYDTAGKFQKQWLQTTLF